MVTQGYHRSLTGACSGVITELPSALPGARPRLRSPSLTSVSEPLDVQLLKRTEDEPQEYNAIDMQLASPGPR